MRLVRLRSASSVNLCRRAGVWYHQGSFEVRKLASTLSCRGPGDADPGPFRLVFHPRLAG